MRCPRRREKRAKVATTLGSNTPTRASRRKPGLRAIGDLLRSLPRTDRERLTGAPREVGSGGWVGGPGHAAMAAMARPDAVIRAGPSSAVIATACPCCAERVCSPTVTSNGPSIATIRR